MSEPVEPAITVPVESAASSGPPLHLRFRAIALVGLGGLLGTALRHRLGVWFPVGGWPAVTFVINVVGAFVLGVLLEGLARLGPDSGRRRIVRLGVGTGGLGAFTTYSALAVDTDLLLRDHRWPIAVGYAGGTVTAGLLATTAGIALAVRVRGVPR